MTIDMYTIFAVAVVFLSALAQSAFGFGNALLAMPVLALFFRMDTVTPFIAMVGVALNLTILAKHWRSANLRGAWRLVVSSVLGIPVGLYLLKTSHDAPLKIALGVLVVAFSIHALTKPRLMLLKSDKLAYLFGFGAGIIAGACNTNGPPVVIYGSLRRWAPTSLRSTLQAYFLPIGLVVSLGHCGIGLWTPSVLTLFACSIPAIFMAVILGNRFHRSVTAGSFDRCLHVLLLLTGILLLARTVVELMVAQ